MTGLDQRVAIVGLACRYPDADDPSQLWRSVLARRRAFRALPPGRLDPAHRAGAPHDPDSTTVHRAGVLRGWTFDRQRFRVPGTLYRAADPTHWLALEVAADALADAGFPDGTGLDRDRVGVVLGNSLTGEFTRAATIRLRWPFLRSAFAAALGDAPDAAAVLDRAGDLIRSAFPEPTDETLAGGLSNTIAGRISNHFDFHGTGYTVDGACASSLLAVITASRALVAGELDFALAGGVDLSLDPFEMVGFARIGALADTEMRVYDARPTGFLPGEGCGIVALVRADEARRRDLRVYATIAGWGTSSDGAGGLTRPERDGQARALRRAYRAARIDPGEVTLVEGHGTGTAVGDTVELRALRAVRGSRPATAALGSVKANIGHTKAAAGAASLIKAALAIHHRILPPTTGCVTPHELLDPDAGLEVLAEPRPWDVNLPRAAVSAFGFGGINTHVVLEGRYSRHTGRRGVLPAGVPTAPPADDIVLVEAATVTELGDRLRALAGWAPALSDAELHDVAATAAATATGTAPLRCALVAADPPALAAAASSAAAMLDTWAGGVALDEEAGVALAAGGPARVGLLLPGQAAPVRSDLGALGRLVAGVPDLPEAGDGTDRAQPAIVRQSVAGLRWLDRLGCTPVGAVGHSLGELTAAAWGGALSLDAAVRLAAERGRLMQLHGERATGMLAVELPEAAAAELAGEHGLQVAAVNAPDRTVLAGTEAALEAALATATARGVAAARLPVTHGFHSPAMAAAQAAWAATLTDTPFAPVSRPVHSTVTGRPLAGDDLRAVLTRQLTAPVRFHAAARELAQSCDLLVEVGPGTMLTALCARFAAVPAVSLDCGGPARRLAFATAALAAAAAADLTPWFAGREHRPLPPQTPLTFLENPCGAGVPAPTAAAPGTVRQPSPAPPAPAALPPVPPDPAGSSPAAAEPAVARPDAVEPAAATVADPLTAVRDLLSAELELPPTAIEPDTRLLGDLHLNSLRVGQLVAAVAKALGRRPPVAPLTLAEATVAEVAEVVAALPEAAGDAESDHHEIAGAESWVRLFRHEWEPYAGGAAASALRWQVVAPAGHPLHALPRGEDGNLAVALDGRDEAGVADLLAGIARAAPRRLLIVHDGHALAAAAGRAVDAELAGCAVTVVDGPAGDPPVHDSATGVLELRAAATGGYERRITRVHRTAAGGDPVLGPADLLVVTGGVAGITAHAAGALAARTGCRLLVLGRRPAADADVVAGLDRLRTVARAEYRRCDISDPRAVAALVREIGPVAGLLHGAAFNEPQRMADLTPAALRAHLAAKRDGLRALLAACGDGLRLVVGFGSIIGRYGLAGQAAYALANDAMRVELEAWAATRPGCRTRVLEWSVWSGLGMGVRLDAVDRLRRAGIAPIGPVDGAATLLAAVEDPAAPVTLLATGRFPQAAWSLPGRTHAGRFLERVRVDVPGVEIVAEAGLTTGADPYLADHRLQGTPVLPAVVGLEAMAQAAAHLVDAAGGWTFRDARFTAPVAVDPRGTRTVRTAAVASPDGREVRVALRDDSDGFATERFAATVSPADPAPEPSTTDGPAGRGNHHWYGPVLFHEGRFQRLRGVDLVSAFALHAWIDAGDTAGWFAPVLDQRLSLGDPAAHDAAIHALLACAPHRRVLPVAVAEVTVLRPPAGRLRVAAVETEHTATGYVFDLDVTDERGGPVARWRGLRLADVGPNEAFDAARRAGTLPLDLVGPWLSRRLIECGSAPPVVLSVAPGQRADGAGRRLLAALLGVDAAAIGRRPEGGPAVPEGWASLSYTAGHVLAAASAHRVGVDWQETADPRRPAAPGGPDPSGREWVVREALVKLGASPEEPLTLARSEPDGVELWTGRAVEVLTATVGGLTVAVAVGRD